MRGSITMPPQRVKAMILKQAENRLLKRWLSANVDNCEPIFLKELLSICIFFVLQPRPGLQTVQP